MCACASSGSGHNGDDDDGDDDVVTDGGGDDDTDGGGGDDDTDGGGGDDDGDDDPIDFSNNLFPSPMPPGNLTPANAPQIIVFGWDDCAFTGDHPNDTAQAADSGMNFIVKTF